MTKYFGVASAGDKFKVQVNRKGRVFYLGTYDTVQEAAVVADISAIISKVWATLPPRLNWTTTEVPDEQFWNEHQKNMMQFLRLNFPEDERNAKREQALALYTPDVLFEHFSLAQIKLKTIYEEVSSILLDGKQVLKRAAAKNAEDAQLIEWQRAKIAELEERSAGKKFVEDIVKRQGYLMKPITPESIKADAEAREAKLREEVRTDTAPVELPGETTAEVNQTNA